jgi:hypothetical protein
MLIIKEIDLFGLLSLSYQYSCWVVHRFVIPLLILFLLLNFSLFPFLCYGTIPIITFFVQRAIYTSISPSFNSISTVVLVSIHKQLITRIYTHVGGSPLISLVELILIESSHTIFLCYCCCFLVFIQTCDEFKHPDFASIMHIHKPSLWRTRDD